MKNLNLLGTMREVSYDLKLVYDRLLAVDALHSALLESRPYTRAADAKLQSKLDGMESVMIDTLTDAIERFSEILSQIDAAANAAAAQEQAAEEKQPVKPHAIKGTPILLNATLYQ